MKRGLKHLADLFVHDFSSCSFSNQSAAEKMSLEDEIKRCKVSFTSATRRSQTAQVGPSQDAFHCSMLIILNDAHNVPFFF